MSIVKQERHENEATVFACRAEAGLQSMRAWLFARREETNKKWISSNDAMEVARLQGEAGLVNKLIDMIDQGPKIKGETA